jgi:arsenate reductase
MRRERELITPVELPGRPSLTGPRRPWMWLGVLVVAVAVAATAVFVWQRAERAEESESISASRGSRPDVIVIMTDDQRLSDMVYLPLTQQLVPLEIAPAIVSNPVCCPSRATFLSGLLSQDNGVWSNKEESSGAWPAYRAWDAANTSLNEALFDAGYSTAWHGKFINEWDGEVPDGWTDFRTHVHGPGATGPGSPYFNYTLSGTRETRYYGTADDDYSGRVHTADAIHFMRTADAAAPLFLVYAPNAPHSVGGGKPPLPDPLDRAAAVTLPVDTPNINERRIKDKADFLHKPKMKLQSIATWARARARSMLGVDRSIAELLAETRPGRETLVIFTSDNGYSLGAHRHLAKAVPYEEALRVPLHVSWRGQQGVLERLTSNLDLSATIAEVTGLGFASAGTSIFGPGPGRVVIQGAASTKHNWCGVRTLDQKFILYADGHQETYDLRDDPWELRGGGRSLGLERWTRAHCHDVVDDAGLGRSMLLVQLGQQTVGLVLGDHLDPGGPCGLGFVHRRVLLVRSWPELRRRDTGGQVHRAFTGAPRRGAYGSLMMRAMADQARPRVVFLCVHNAGRSQMAAGWALDLGAGEVEVFSGGSDPAAEVNPVAVAAMAEVGIDISGAAPGRWTEDILRSADVVVTMGCGDTCPVFPGVRYVDWDVADPSGLELANVREIRDEIGARVGELITDVFGEPRSPSTDA